MKKEDFAKRSGSSSFDKRLHDFEEEISQLGKGLEKDMEKAGKKLERRYYRRYGLLGPFLWSLVTLIFLALAIWVFDSMGGTLNSFILTEIAAFIDQYLALFFVLSLFFNYTSYIFRYYPERSRFISPPVKALGGVVTIWVLTEMMLILNTEFNISALDSLLILIQEYLLGIFVFLTVVIYIAMIAEGFEPVERKKYQPSSVNKFWDKNYDSKKEVYHESDLHGIKRLYRSNQDKLLGGVCGGLGNYIGIDPVLIRILWVIFAVASFGTAILVYIIFWIIIPRNPYHRWD
ncbi:MAG: PspC domain-containing protein [Thermoplasmatota archaeon]